MRYHWLGEQARPLVDICLEEENVSTDFLQNKLFKSV
jgi:hypothetical protein